MEKEERFCTFFESVYKHVVQGPPVNTAYVDLHKLLMRSLTKDPYRNKALLG